MVYARLQRGWGDRHLRQVFRQTCKVKGTIFATRGAQSGVVPWPRWMLLALAALSGCAAPALGTMASQMAASEVAAHDAVSAEATLDRTVTPPSGATLKVAADWTVTASTDGLILEDPEKQVSGVRESQAFLPGEQRDWKVPPGALRSEAARRLLQQRGARRDRRPRGQGRGRIPVRRAVQRARQQHVGPTRDPGEPSSDHAELGLAVGSERALVVGNAGRPSGHRRGVPDG